MTALSDLLNNAKGDQSVDALIRSAEARGSAIDRATVYNALNGKHAKRPKDPTLQALAAVFGLDIREVRVAAGSPAGELGPWVPPSQADQLPQPVRDALDNLIKAIASEGGGERERGSAPIVPLRPVGQHEVDEAAYSEKDDE